jgi:hypothetical protein
MRSIGKPQCQAAHHWLDVRCGFANWVTSNGWDLKTLMEYVGWKDVQWAMR